MRCLSYVGLLLGIWACGIKGPLRPPPKAKVEAQTPAAAPTQGPEEEGVVEEKLPFKEEQR
ncbi:MAG: hypothetical protein FWC28_02660 [Proteobacteria bacterium]|nr:hypothetical protein [Cystobacterineae bacterium]MCL2259400.1 hypothetical protein [Cystobacterineae bacterium]MCL2314140.1 hypothetical protein [Pseudomonadota bacterium]